MKIGSDVLRKARSLISDREKWAIGDLAQRNDGFVTWPTFHDAVRWCAIGACVFAAYDEDIDEDGLLARGAEDVLNQVAIDIMREHNIKLDEEIMPAAVLNDYGQHKLVLEMFDRAIARSEEEENNAT